MTIKTLLSLTTLTLISVPAMAQVASQSTTPANDPTPFQVVSTDLTDGQPISDLYVLNDDGCTGKNETPVLTWSYPPDGTKSFAVTMFDATARRGDGWMHWTLLNIPATETVLPHDAANKLPAGTVVVPNSYGKSEYDGPCPPVGDKPHKYTFTVYAMPDGYEAYPLNAVGWSTIDWLSNNSLAKASITVTYQRPLQ